jgi:hypothetical protein
MNRPAGPPCGRARTRRCALGRVLINHIRSAPGTDVRCTPTSGARVDAPRLRISATSGLASPRCPSPMSCAHLVGARAASIVSSSS